MGGGKEALRVLVIGGSGFIGKHVVEKLRACGETVGALHRTSKEPGLTGDRDRIEDLERALRGFHPDVVIDMILYTEPQARALVGVMRGRLVVVSSGDVYRNYDGLRRKSAAAPDPGPANEDAPLREARFPYRGAGYPFDHAEDYDKIPVEQVVMSLPRATVLRLPAVYGPEDAQHRLRAYLRRMADQRPAIILGEAQAGWRWTRGYVENVAEAIALATRDERAAGHIYNVGEDPTLSEREWVQRIAAAAGWRGEIVTVREDAMPEALRRPFDWRYDLHASTARIRQELGYAEPVSADVAMKRSIAWEWERLGEAEPPDYRAEDEVLSAR